MDRHAAAAARRLPVGTLVGRDGTHFRVWAPAASQVEVVFESPGLKPIRLEPEDKGYFSGYAFGVRPGVLYRFRLDGGPLYPDPASFYQPNGPLGASQVVDHSKFGWTDAAWRGVSRDDAVLYELHVGTFTPEGTYIAAANRLAELAKLGVNVIELMPVADYAGKFGWGYDGVNWFAPCRNYGKPDDLRRLVDVAHQNGIAVVLDVVYNHYGPVGNFLPKFSPTYTTDKYRTDWGPAVNFDGEGSEGVRELVLANVQHWIEHYHFDGLRLDATQNIYDRSGEHILGAIVRRARETAGERTVLLVAENEPQREALLRPPEEGGYGFDMMWVDDFHHAASVALTGRREAYLCGYSGSPQEFVSVMKWGFLYQGQYYAWQKKRRGSPSFGLKGPQFVFYLENHDQLANAAGGRRMLERTGAARYRALTTLLLLGPQTPMLFQGQEAGAKAPFNFFADHDRELAPKVFEGRRAYMRQFPSLAQPGTERLVPDPAAFTTVNAATWDAYRDHDPKIAALVKDLLRLRRSDPVFASRPFERLEGAVLGPEAFVLRFFGPEADRLLIVNLGVEFRFENRVEPLLGCLPGRRWELLWHSEDPTYGGCGMPPLERPHWTIPGEAAAVLHPVPFDDESPEPNGTA